LHFLYYTNISLETTTNATALLKTDLSDQVNRALSYRHVYSRFNYNPHFIISKISNCLHFYHAFIFFSSLRLSPRYFPQHPIWMTCLRTHAYIHTHIFTFAYETRGYVNAGFTEKQGVEMQNGGRYQRRTNGRVLSTSEGG